MREARAELVGDHGGSVFHGPLRELFGDGVGRPSGSEGSPQGRGVGARGVVSLLPGVCGKEVKAGWGAHRAHARVR